MSGTLRRRDRGALLLNDAFLVASAFLASAVESVEALTIVLAMGLTRGWRAALIGTGVALIALAAIIALLGPALTVIPIEVLRLVVGALLLVFGLQWLRKAILRASGWRALRDEDAAFAREAAAAQAAPHEEHASVDWYGFTIAFKGVLLEGLEVAFIVLTFGSTQGSVPLAAVGAAAAVVLVVVAGVVVRGPLARVPENTLAFAVGVMLTTFGIFWGAEGAGVDWPGGDAALPVVLAFVLLMSLGYVSALRRRPLPA
ncbi:MAG: COG4280 domain-containing protein [Gaiellaceae bacterium]